MQNPYTLLWFEQEMADAYLVPEDVMAKKWTKAFGDLDAMRRYLSERGIPWAGLLIPTRTQGDPFYRTLMEMYLFSEIAEEQVDWNYAPRRLSQWYAAQGVPLFDFAGTVGDSGAPAFYRLNNTNLNVQGNRLLAEGLLDFLSEKSLLPPASPKNPGALGLLPDN